MEFCFLNTTQDIPSEGWGGMSTPDKLLVLRCQLSTREKTGCPGVKKQSMGAHLRCSQPEVLAYIPARMPEA